MRRYDRNQTNWNEILDDGFYVIFTLITSISKVILLSLPSFLDASFIEYGNYLLERNFRRNLVKNPLT